MPLLPLSAAFAVYGPHPNKALHHLTPPHLHGMSATLSNLLALNGSEL